MTACGSVSPRACHPPNTVCCKDELINCPAGTLCCGTDAPGFCHPVNTKCCKGTLFNCPITSTCCGDSCCPYADDDGNLLKCGTGPAEGSVCCGEYKTPCDKYCKYCLSLLCFLDIKPTFLKVVARARHALQMVCMHLHD